MYGDGDGDSSGCNPDKLRGRSGSGEKALAAALFLISLHAVNHPLSTRFTPLLPPRFSTHSTSSRTDVQTLGRYRLELGGLVKMGRPRAAARQSSDRAFLFKSSSSYFLFLVCIFKPAKETASTKMRKLPKFLNRIPLLTSSRAINGDVGRGVCCPPSQKMDGKLG